MLIDKVRSHWDDLVRNYWDTRPCNIRHSAAEVGTRQYFDEVEFRKYFVEPHIPFFAQFEQWRDKRVLEIGCGIGTDAVRFAQAGAYYTGMDISEKSVALASKRFALYGLTGAFYVGNAEELSEVVPVQTFDLVYAFGVIHHCPMPDLVVSQVKYYLGVDSEFRLMLYAEPSWKQIMILAGLDQSEAQAGCPVARTYTAARAYSLLRDFEILSMHQDHIFTYDVEKYVRYEYEPVPWFAAMPAPMLKALRKALGWHLLIKCKKRV